MPVVSFPSVLSRNSKLLLVEAEELAPPPVALLGPVPLSSSSRPALEPQQAALPVLAQSLVQKEPEELLLTPCWLRRLLVLRPLLALLPYVTLVGLPPASPCSANQDPAAWLLGSAFCMLRCAHDALVLLFPPTSAPLRTRHTRA